MGCFNLRYSSHESQFPIQSDPNIIVLKKTMNSFVREMSIVPYNLIYIACIIVRQYVCARRSIDRNSGFSISIVTYYYCCMLDIVPHGKGRQRIAEDLRRFGGIIAYINIINRYNIYSGMASSTRANCHHNNAEYY